MLRSISKQSRGIRAVSPGEERKATVGRFAEKEGF